jgi:hypothetical protein
MHFCEIWDRMMGIEVRNEFTEKCGKGFPQLWKAQAPWKDVEAKGVFRLTQTGPIFVAETLYMGMVVKLLMVANTENYAGAGTQIAPGRGTSLPTTERRSIAAKSVANGASAKQSSTTGVRNTGRGLRLRAQNQNRGQGHG